MRAPLKYLAPLLLLPFLACDGSPLETDTEQSATELVQPADDALFGNGLGWGPKPPEPPYTQLEIRCRDGMTGYISIGEVPTPLDVRADCEEGDIPRVARRSGCYWPDVWFTVLWRADNTLACHEAATWDFAEKLEFECGATTASVECIVE